MAPSIQVHRYTLETVEHHSSAVSSYPQVGALIKVEQLGVFGYGSIHPWPQYGDAPLQDHIDSIRSGSLTNLAERAMHFAKIDGAARQESESLFLDLSVPPSHQLIHGGNSNPLFLDHSLLPTVESMQDTAPTRYKIKVTGDIETEAAALEKFKDSPVLLRLDANGRYSEKEFIQFWSLLSHSVKSKIEFVEDPCPYNPVRWKVLHEDLSIPLAYDFYGSNKVEKHYDFRIIKPVIQPYEQLVQQETDLGRKIVVTSSMDHPFGIRIAAWVSGKLFASFPESVIPGGYSFPNLNSNDPFYGVSLKSKLSLHETGFGFDDILASLYWSEL